MNATAKKDLSIAVEAPTNTFKKLTKTQLNKISDIGNIGMANAAIALSKLTGASISLSIPSVEVQDIVELIDVIGGPEAVIAAIIVDLENELEGTCIFTLDKKEALRLIDVVTQLPEGATVSVNADNSSALTEITNIIASSFINTLVKETGFIVMPTVPMFSLDMAGAVLDSIIAKYAMMSEYALLIKTEFFQNDNRIIGDFFLLLSEEHLKKLIKRLEELG